ncbi:hypothetical protein [Bacillus massiliigorillae]|uniref:hypothetical protein n=1 Tax=Bacillus massiliigorillae TaxID=1243664 RepID=UPI0003A857E8|nr:hypothetical protein [Bacillus massiliigorillae]
MKKFLFLAVTVFLLAIAGCSEKNEAEEIQPKEEEQKQTNNESSSGLPEKLSEGKATFAVGRDWKESEHFKNGNSSLIGTPNLLGVSFDLNDKFYTNKPQKHIWYFWGSAAKLSGKFTVKAIHKDTAEQVELIKDNSLGGPLNGADNHTPTSMKFTKSGMWALDAYINDKLFGSVTVIVEDQK